MFICVNSRSLDEYYSRLAIERHQLFIICETISSVSLASPDFAGAILPELQKMEAFVNGKERLIREMKDQLCQIHVTAGREIMAAHDLAHKLHH